MHNVQRSVNMAEYMFKLVVLLRVKALGQKTTLPNPTTDNSLFRSGKVIQVGGATQI